MTSHVTSEVPCNLCTSTDVTVVGRRSRNGSPLRTVACRQCGLVWSDPRPIETRKFYEEDYRLAYKRTFQPRPKHVLRAGRVAIARLSRIRHLLPGRERVLDIGCGGGEFAYLLKRLGHIVHGVEPNRGYAHYAAARYGLEITRAMVGDASLPAQAYQLITIWHVLEHTEDPAAVLTQLRNALAAQGLLVVEVPNVESRCQSPRSTFHEAHLYNFNKATLVAMAAKAGLRPQSIELTPDGGNIVAVFHPAPATTVPESHALPGNHAQVAQVLREHRPTRYWMSMHPYRRALNRLARAAGEWLAVRTAGSKENLLDRLYDGALEETSPVSSRPPVPTFSWVKVTIAYALAVTLEWFLLDRAFNLHTMTDAQALAAYMATQALVVLAVVKKTRPRRNMKAWFRLTVLGGPLFLIPAYC